MNKSELKDFIESKFEALMKNPHYAFTCQAKVYQNILKEVENLEPTSEEAWKKVGEFYGLNQYEAVSIFEKGLKSNGIVFDPTKIYISCGEIFKVNEKIDSDRWKGYVGYRYIIKKGEFEGNFKFSIGSPFSLKAREANKDEVLLFEHADAGRNHLKTATELRNAYLQEVGE